MNGAISRDVVIKYESIKRSNKFDMDKDFNIIISILWPKKSSKEAFYLYSSLRQIDKDLMKMYFLDDNFNFPKFKYNGVSDYIFE